MLVVGNLIAQAVDNLTVQVAWTSLQAVVVVVDTLIEVPADTQPVKTIEPVVGIPADSLELGRQIGQRAGMPIGMQMRVERQFVG